MSKIESKNTASDEEVIKQKNEGNNFSSLIRRRFIVATMYSLSGLSLGFRKEEAFRVEIILTIIAIPLIFVIADTVVEGLLLLFSMAILLITELLNSAIETTVDRIGVEYNDLSKQAKDLGSAAVFISIILALITWTAILLF